MVRRVRAPLVRPHRSAHGVETSRDVIVVEQLVDDGPSGWGECPTLSTPGYVTETTESAWQAFAAGAVSGPAASAAVSDAVLDARLRSVGTSLVDRFGATRSAVPRCGVIADVGADAATVADRAVRLLADGAAMVKVKVVPGRDVEILQAVIDAVGDPSLVAIDANGSYPDVAALRAVDALGLRYIEQPFDHRLGLETLALWHRGMATPVALDESIRSPTDVDRVIESGAADIVSLKPARMGGVEAARSASIAAAAAGLGAFVGGMLELGIGRATAACLAAVDACDLPTDLGPSSAYVATDIVAPIEVDGDGRLQVPQGPGCGRTPDPQLLAEMTVATASIRP